MKLKTHKLLVPAFLLVIVPFFSSAAVNKSTDTIPAANKIYTQVNIQPEFPGGLKAFGDFLAKNIKYPAVDREAKVQGRVIVQFIIEKDGSLTDIKAIRGPSKTLMDEALRVMAMSPQWKPGTQNDKPVRVAYTVPINFNLNNEPLSPPFKRTPSSTTTPGK